MSVINKMLRDLDHRQAAPSPTGTPAAAQTPLRQGTASLAQSAGPIKPLSRRWFRTGLVGLVVAAAAAGAWLWMQPGVPATVAIPVSTPLADPVTPLTPAAPVVADIASTTSVGNAEPGAMVLRMEESLSARRALDALLSTSTPPGPAIAAAPLVVPAVARERTKAAGPATPVAAKQPDPATAKAPAAAPQTDTTAPPPVAQRQQQAGGDAMAQVQSLWNNGSRDAAIDLMQQSIAAAERAVKAGSGANASLVLIPLAREMARMQLAEGRFGAVWEMLTRLEPQLGNQPDLWAIRANAAQRLGRHQDSVHAYMVALQSRPDEQRWLLGTAVSLAALGQISSASEMAEKARAVGPVSKDILAYLRQAGVVFRD